MGAFQRGIWFIWFVWFVGWYGIHFIWSWFQDVVLMYSGVLLRIMQVSGDIGRHSFLPPVTTTRMFPYFGIRISVLEKTIMAV